MIRFATEDDLNAVRRFDPVAKSILRSKAGAKELILAFSGSEPIGYLRLEYLWSKIPYIGLIVVKEDLRGHGVGKKILRFLEDYLRAKGHKTLFSSSQANEPRPQHWHRRMGFVECGIIVGINEGQVGEVFFRKDLA